MLGNRIAGHLLDQPDVAVRLLLRAAAHKPVVEVNRIGFAVEPYLVFSTGCDGYPYAASFRSSVSAHAV